MIQEYLFYDRTIEKKLSTYGYDNNSLMLYTNNFGKECLIARYETNSNNENDAKILSEINENLKGKYKFATLSNGASEYFNKSLFPLFNSFERKLRKLIYLASTYNEVTEASEIVDNIENYDFGKIFDELFTDVKFVQKAKTIVNDKGRNRYSKKEIIKKLDQQTEDILWDKIVGDDNVSSLCSNFLDVKSFRNDVMHAHNITYKDYKLAKNLMTKINSELDVEIGRYLNTDKVLLNLDLSGFLAGLENIIKATTKINEKQINFSEFLSKMFESSSENFTSDTDTENRINGKTDE